MNNQKQFQSRVDLWVGRYEDTKNEAVMFYSTKNQRLEWELGETEKHCGTCAALNGIIAFASEWETAGVMPQSPPNELLECGGWQCDCKLKPTDERRSADALTRILDAITAGNVGKSVKGGEGSGNFGHEGRPGEVGGSASDGGGTARDEAARQLYSGYENDENTSTVYRDGKLVGFYNGHVAKNPPEKIKKLVGSKPFVLSAIATFEKGYGRELVSAAINTARSSGASGVVFYSDNENSSGFYSHLGISRSDDDKEIFYITKKEFGNY